MKVISVPMHCFASNCYLVASEKGNCAVIDPGMEPETIINAIEQNHVKMKIQVHGPTKALHQCHSACLGLDGKSCSPPIVSRNCPVDDFKN